MLGHTRPENIRRDAENIVAGGIAAAALLVAASLLVHEYGRGPGPPYVQHEPDPPRICEDIPPGLVMKFQRYGSYEATLRLDGRHAWVAKTLEGASCYIELRDV